MLQKRSIAPSLSRSTRRITNVLAARRSVWVVCSPDGSGDAGASVRVEGRQDVVAHSWAEVEPEAASGAQLGVVLGNGDAEDGLEKLLVRESIQGSDVLGVANIFGRVPAHFTLGFLVLSYCRPRACERLREKACWTGLAKSGTKWNERQDASRRWHPGPELLIFSRVVL